MSDIIWILVADATQARLFGTEGGDEPLMERQDLLHSASRSKVSELVSDQPGKHSGSGFTGSHAMENKQDIKDRERDSFARDIATMLDSACAQKLYRRLYLVAPSHMLGSLHKHLAKPTMESVEEEFDLLLVKESAEKIRHHLPRHL